MLKTWTEKLNCTQTTQLKRVPMHLKGPVAGMKPGQLMLVPNPHLLDKAIRAIPIGQHVPVAELRAQLAAEHKADVTCPITVGFHIRTLAEAAFERVQAGAGWADVTPFWRVIDAKSPTLKKLSFDTAVVAQMREAEGLPA